VCTFISRWEEYNNNNKRISRKRKREREITYSFSAGSRLMAASWD
jgi:hypothetical protein